MRKLRGLVANRLVEVTTRTIQSRYLLRPSRDVNQIVLGVLGRAQRRTGMALCGFTFLSNHYHLLAVPETTEQLSEFVGYLNGNIARKVGHLHEWSGKFWHRRYQHIIVSEEPEAQVGRLRYLLSQGVKEGLVRHPEDWPGAHCVDQLLGGWSEVRGGVWRDSTAESKARNSSKKLKKEDFLFEEIVHIQPIPCLLDAEPAERRALMGDLRKEAIDLARDRQRSSGRPPLGRKKILQQRPHDRPAETKSSPAPHYHAVSRDHHDEHRERYRDFADAYRSASEQLRAGDRTALFPPGSFPPRLPYAQEPRAGPSALG